MNYQHKYLKYKSKYLEKKYGRKFRFRYKIDYDNDLDYKQKYLKYKSKYLNIYLKHSSANNNLDYQKKYFKYKSKYLNIKYGGTCKLKIDINYDNNLDYQQKYLKYKSKYLYFKKQQEGGVFGVLGAIFNPIGKVLEPVTTHVTTQVTTPVIALLTPQTSTTPVKAPAATPVVAKPAATPVKAPPATPVVAKPAATPVKAPAAKPAIPTIPAPAKNTFQYTSPYKTETKTVLKIKNSKSQENIQTFLENFYNNEQGKQDGVVNHGSYDEINKNINKIINQDRIYDRTNNKFELPPYNKVKYNFNKFEDVENAVHQVIDSIDRHYRLKNNYSDRAKIMDAVIAEYFDPNYEPKKIPEKTVKTSLMSRFGF